MKLDVGKSQIVVYGKTERRGLLDLSWNVEILEEVDSFEHLRSAVNQNVGVVEDGIN